MCRRQILRQRGRAWLDTNDWVYGPGRDASAGVRRYRSGESVAQMDGQELYRLEQTVSE